MVPVTPRLKLFLVLAGVQVGCLAIAAWMGHRLVISAVHRAAEDEAATRLAAQLDETLAAGGQRPDRSSARVDPKVLARGLRTLPGVPGVEWIVADWRLRVLDLGADAESAAVEAVGEPLIWIRATRDGGPIRGVLALGPRRLVAAAAAWPGLEGYVVTGRAQESVAVAPELSHFLAAGALVFWAWTSVLLAIPVYLIVARLHDRLASRQAQAEAEALRRTQSLVRTRDALVFGLARLAESRDEVTGRHVERVGMLASRLAAAAADHPRFRDTITPEFVEHVGVASVLHDIGKVVIEDAILLKAGQLTEAERARMQQHTTVGGKFLAEIEQRLGVSRVIRMAREIALWHHEHWDGTGYPDGLAGEHIPLSARIVAVADVYEALTSLRDYKPPYSHACCLEILGHEAGKQFDPDLVTVFLKAEQTFRQIVCRFGEPMFEHADSPQAVGDSREPQCEGLVSVMRVLHQDWVAGTPPVSPPSP